MSGVESAHARGDDQFDRGRRLRPLVSTVHGDTIACQVSLPIAETVSAEASVRPVTP